MNVEQNIFVEVRIGVLSDRFEFSEHIDVDSIGINCEDMTQKRAAPTVPPLIKLPRAVTAAARSRYR